MSYVHQWIHPLHHRYFSVTCLRDFVESVVDRAVIDYQGDSLLQSTAVAISRYLSQFILKGGTKPFYVYVAFTRYASATVGQAFYVLMCRKETAHSPLFTTLVLQATDTECPHNELITEQLSDKSLYTATP